MKPFNWTELWKPELTPVEIVVRAVIVYAAALALFRIVGRKELDEELRHSRVTVDELRSRLRRYGIDRLEAVESAWLECDGNITFVLRLGVRPVVGVGPS